MRFRRLFELWPLLALCLLQAVRWILADGWPSSPSTASSEAIAAALAAALCAALAARGRSQAELAPRWTPAAIAPAALAGVLLFGGLGVSLLIPGAMPRAFDLMIGMSLTPIVIVVTLMAFSGAGGGLTGADLLPGLCAGAGLLLILPQPALDSYAADAVLVLSPAAVGVGATWLAWRGKEALSAVHATAAFAGAAVLFGAVSLRAPRSRPTLPAIGLDLLTLLLTLYTLRQLGLRRFGTQFAAVPLLLLLEGLLLTRVHPNWQQNGGLLLLMFASALLLRKPDPAERVENPSLFA